MNKKQSNKKKEEEAKRQCWLEIGNWKEWVVSSEAMNVGELIGGRNVIIECTRFLLFLPNS